MEKIKCIFTQKVAFRFGEEVYEYGGVYEIEERVYNAHTFRFKKVPSPAPVVESKPDTKEEYVCKNCGKICASRAGLLSHRRACLRSVAKE